MGSIFSEDDDLSITNFYIKLPQKDNFSGKQVLLLKKGLFFTYGFHFFVEYNVCVWGSCDLCTIGEDASPFTFLFLYIINELLLMINYFCVVIYARSIERLSLVWIGPLCALLSAHFILLFI